MLPSELRRTNAETQMLEIVKGQCEDIGFNTFEAVDQRGTIDYLQKILNMIRGCGFGIAVFSVDTPAKTLANIFYELGICTLFGKSVLLCVSGDGAVPSDFVRTEYYRFDPSRREEFQQGVTEGLLGIKQAASYFDTIGDLAMDADPVDPELAFERYRQSLLIQNTVASREKVSALIEFAKNHADAGSPFDGHRRELCNQMQRFLRLLDQ